MKFLIVGGPGTGKTSYSQFLVEWMKGYVVYHTDQNIGMDWDLQKKVAAETIQYLNHDIVIEGCAVSRGLKQLKDTNPTLKPADIVVYCRKVQRDLLPRAVSLGKRIDETMAELIPWLKSLDVTVITIE